MTHATLSKLSAGDSAGATAIATYYTKGIKAELMEYSPEDLKAMVGYYTGEDIPHQKPQARWFGGSAEGLGLTNGSPCTADQLRRVLQRLNPNEVSTLPGTERGGRTTSALDLTISFEKDLSILWLFGTEEVRREIESIIEESIHAGLEWNEKQTAVVRRGAGGLAHHSASGLLAVEVDHVLARPVEGLAAPHLHRHVVIMNLAEENGRWSALDATRLYDLQKATGAIIGARMRELTKERLGVTWVREDEQLRDGVFRIEGFDGGLRNRLSLRQQQILDKALDDGLDVTNRDDWVKAQRVSREGKSACGDDPTEAQWAIDMLAAEGITYESVLNHIAEAQEARRVATEDRVWIDATYGPEPAEALAAKDWRLEVARGLAIYHLDAQLQSHYASHPEEVNSDITPAWDDAEAAMSIDTRSQDVIIHDALLTVGREKSTWRYKDLIVALSNVGVPLDQAEKEIAHFLSGPEAVYLYGIEDEPSKMTRVRTVDQALYVTAETLKKEALLLKAVRNGISKMAPVIPEEGFEQVLATLGQSGMIITPDSDQYDALQAVLLGHNQIHLISGQAGAGKSAGMKALALAQELGMLGEVRPFVKGEPRHLRAVGCALAANAAENLEEESGLASYSITMLLARLKSGLVVLEEGAIVTVDECSQASTSQLADLWEHVERANGRMILVGDTRQLQAVEAGGLYSEMIETTPYATSLLDETRRQRVVEERAVLAAFHDCVGTGTLRDQSIAALKKQGVSEEFLADLSKSRLYGVKQWYEQNNRIVVHATAAEAAEAIAKSYWDAVEETGGDASKAALVLARSNKELTLLDHALVSEAVARGHLDANKTVAFGRREFLEGQRVVARKVHRQLNILNGQVATIEGVEEVDTQWNVTFDTPSVNGVTRKFRNVVGVGETVSLGFSARQVNTEKKNAAKYLASREALLTRAQTRLVRAQESGTVIQGMRAVLAVEKRFYELEEAKRWNEWAEQLPDGGGYVSLTTTAVEVTERDKRLVVRMEDGTKRHLTEGFVNRHVDSGYATTTQRGQGQTVEHGIEYGQITYVGMSRGRADNTAHLVVPEPNPEILEKDIESLAPTIEWLKATMGEDEATILLSDAATSLRSRSLPKATPVVAGVEVSVRGDDASTTRRLAGSVARSQDQGPRTVALAKSSAMAREISDGAVREIVGASGGKIKSVTLDGRKWVRDMPVYLAHGEVAGLTHGESYRIVALSPTSMFIEDSTGTRTELDAELVHKHIESGFAVTTSWAQANHTGAEKFIINGSGLTADDFAWVVADETPTEIVICDPAVKSERTRRDAYDEQVMALLKQDSGAGWQARSASAMLRANGAEEIGLESLQQEIRLSSKAIDVVRNMAPRDVARRDVEQKIVELRKLRDELDANLSTMEPGQDEVDTRAGLRRRTAELDELNETYQLLLSAEPDSHPEIVRELATSAAYHAQDTSRLAEVERKLNRYVQARVTAAMKQPRPYHRVPVDTTLTPEAAQARRLLLLTRIEEYRTKWGIDDPNEALGEVPTMGAQLDEWASLADELGVESRLDLELEI